MKRIVLLVSVVLISLSLLQAQGFSPDDSSTVFKNKAGKVLNKEEVQELMKGKFDMKKDKLPDGRMVITIIPADNQESPERVAQRKMIEDFKKTLVGKSLTEFKFEDIKGNKLDSKKLKGKVFVINFWFTTCQPCIAEMPLLNELVAAYQGKEVVFIAPGLDKDAAITKFLKKYSFDYQIVANQTSYADKLKIENFPTHIITDKKGIIKEVEVGYDKAIKEKLGKTIDGLL